MRLDLNMKPRADLQDLAQGAAQLNITKGFAKDRIHSGAKRLGKQIKRHILMQHTGIGMQLRHLLIITLNQRHQ